MSLLYYTMNEPEDSLKLVGLREEGKGVAAQCNCNEVRDSVVGCREVSEIEKPQQSSYLQMSLQYSSMNELEYSL